MWQRARGPHGLKEEEIKGYFFKRPTKQKVPLVLLVIWENIFYFVLRNNWRMKEEEGGSPRQRSRSVEEGESENNKARRHRTWERTLGEGTLSPFASQRL